MEAPDWDAARWPDWRSPANDVENSAGDAKIWWESKGRRSRSLGLGPGLGEGFRAGQSSRGVGLDDLFLQQAERANDVEMGIFVILRLQEEAHDRDSVLSGNARVTLLTIGGCWSRKGEKEECFFKQF